MERSQDTVLGEMAPQSAGNDNAPTVEGLQTKRTLSPRERVLELCREVVWWHHAMGSPVQMSDIFSRNRERFVTAVRGDCIRRVRLATKWSLPKVGKFFGLDHTTCLHHMQTKGVTKVRSTLTLESARRLARLKREQLLAEKPDRWALVVGQPKYSISSNGLVRFDATGNIRTPQLGNNGYCYVTFQSGPKGKAVYWPIHRMMMEAFVGPRPDGMQICHNDGDRLNNRLSNLRFGTAKDNADDRDWHGMTRRGVRNGNAKLRDQAAVNAIRARYADGGVSQYELADEFGISQAQINNIVLNKQHKTASVNAGAYHTTTEGETNNAQVD